MSSSRREYSRSGGKDGRDSRRRRRSSTASTSSAMSVSMPSLNVTHKRVAVAVILSFCIVSIIDLHKLLSSTADYNGSRSEGRRSLLTSLYLEAHSTLLPWAHHHLVDVLETPDFEKETALFWHVPKSGGTTAKRLYQCMGKTLAHRVGADPRFGHDHDSEVVVFEPHQGKDWKVVNVDTTIKQGIIRAKTMGLVQSHTTDLIFTMEPAFAGENLYDEEHKGRFLALFRHPVERAVSMFYYLQAATWERTYRPEWANMTVMEWANLPNAEENYIVHKLVGKSFGDTVDETDLIIAKELVRQRFIVGLMGEMEESVRRFNIVLGLNMDEERNRACMVEFFPEDATPVEEEVEERETEKTSATDQSNSNKHPNFDENSPEYQISRKQKPPRHDPLPVHCYVSVPEPLQNNLVDVTESFGKDNSSTAFFWHVPKSGGTTLQRMYWCMGMTLANEVGGNPKFHTDRSKLETFKPWSGNPGQVLNVQVATHQGIMDAHRRGFLANEDQPHVDVVSTAEFELAYTLLFNPEHKGRMFALFRHPIERAVSKFYYLRKATWEPTYNKHWKTMTLKEWATKDRGENNWMVRKLVGKDPSAPLSNVDLELAKEIIHTKFLVGLQDRFKESMQRFNIFLGIDESDPQNQRCIQEFTSNVKTEAIQTQGEKNAQNSYSHPELERNGETWISLQRIHMYDVQLFKYIRDEYGRQGVLFDTGADVEIQ
eukprot:g4565.t1 g4565   contig15:1299971-1302522(+)